MLDADCKNSKASCDGNRLSWQSFGYVERYALGGRWGDLHSCVDDHKLGGNLAINAVLFRLRTYLAVLVSSRKYLKCIDLCVVARP